MSAFANRYLVVKRLNSHNEPEVSCVGPFESEAALIAFAKGVRYGGTDIYDNNGKPNVSIATNPPALWITHPDDLFPSQLKNHMMEYNAHGHATH